METWKIKKIKKTIGSIFYINCKYYTIPILLLNIVTY